MPKISRPIVYSVLGAVAVYAIFLNTQPDTSTTRRTVRVVRTATAARPTDPKGVLPEDLSAHFPRYNGGGRNSFAPGVVVAKPKTETGPRAGGIRTGWSLTGIAAVNGVASALIENSGTGESVFLQPGDRWNGLRVVAIRPDSVVFQNALGRQDSITFAEPTDDKTGAGAAGTRNAAVPSAPRLPGLGAASALAPFPVAPLQARPLPGAAAPLPPLQGAPAPPDNIFVIPSDALQGDQQDNSNGQ